MKKILKPLLLSLVAILSINCSSDAKGDLPDEKTDPITKEIQVVDYFTYSFNDSEFGTRTNKVQFFYTNNGNVEKITDTEDRKGKLYIDTTTYEYLDNKLKTVDLTYTINDKLEEHSSYSISYDEKNRISKALFKEHLDKIEDEINVVYNSQNQVIKTIYSQGEKPAISTYEYDLKGNIIKFISGNSNRENIIETVRYDDKKSPFINMNINYLQHSTEFFDEILSLTVKTPNNVIESKFDVNEETNIPNATHLTTNQYNEDGFLISAKSIEVENLDNKYEIIYTYKKIKVLVNN